MQQIALANQYRQMKASGMAKLNLQDVGFRCYSQHEEDGILWYIFSLIGTQSKICVEICCGDGIECNTSNLLRNHKWHGLLIDGSEKLIEIAKTSFAECQDTKFWPPKLVNTWITAEKVNGLISDSGISGDIDLLSLDMDGIDYWVWQNITCVSPRVVILEFNHLWGSEKAMTVPNDPEFRPIFTKYGSDYSGASLKAFVDLARTKGYRFIGTNALCTNAIFLLDSIVEDWLPEEELEKWFEHPRAKFGMEIRFPEVKDKPWQDVS